MFCERWLCRNAGRIAFCEREHALEAAGSDVTGARRVCYIRERGSRGIGGPESNRCHRRWAMRSLRSGCAVLSLC